MFIHNLLSQLYNFVLGFFLKLNYLKYGHTLMNSSLFFLLLLFFFVVVVVVNLGLHLFLLPLIDDQIC